MSLERAVYGEVTTAIRECERSGCTLRALRVTRITSRGVHHSIYTCGGEHERQAIACAERGDIVEVGHIGERLHPHNLFSEATHPCTPSATTTRPPASRTPPPPGRDDPDPWTDRPGLDCGSEWSPEPDYGLSFGADSDHHSRRWRDRDVDVGDELRADPDPVDPDEIPF